MGGPAHRRSRQRHQADRAARGGGQKQSIDHARTHGFPTTASAKRTGTRARGRAVAYPDDGSGGDGTAAMIGEEEKRRSTGNGRGLGGLIYNNLGSCGFGAWLVRSDGRRGVWGHPSGGIGFFFSPDTVILLLWEKFHFSTFGLTILSFTALQCDRNSSFEKNAGLKKYINRNAYVR